jgi:tetratricopeptide (TPR) repeat protein
MRAPDWRKLKLGDGVVPEPGLDDKRIVLWLSAGRDDSGALWERIGNVPGADITSAEGIASTAATVIRARQRVQGFFGKLLGRFRESAESQTWTLPSGAAAEQRGPRQTDLLLAWSEAEATPLDEARIRARWPESQRVQQLGENLFLVSGIEAKRSAKPTMPALAEGEPPQLAEQMLAEARASGDQSRIASALTDLGIALARKNESARSAALLEEALAIVRQLGDRSRESDVLGNLGLALLTSGHVPRALELFDQSLTLARAAGDRYEEKNALERLGHAYSSIRNPAQGQAFYNEALAIAREVGDRAQEADLLWYYGISEADLGRRDSALAWGQAAIDLLRKLGSPAAVALTDHLHKYRLGEAGMWPGAAGNNALMGGSIMAGNWNALPGNTQQPASGPTLLRMGISVAKSMAKFLGSGGQTVSADIRQRRLNTCGACPHHTGIRCRLCGCFTHVKTWMPHEACPIGKW